MPSRTCWSVMAGVYFVSPTGFRHQEPSGDQRERLMMVPALPIADLIVGQAGFTLAPLDALFDPMFRFGDAGKLQQLRLTRGVGQIVIRFEHPLVIAVAIADHDQDFFVALLAPVSSPDHVSFNNLDNQGPLGAVTHFDFGPVGFAQQGGPPVDALPRSLRARATVLVQAFFLLQERAGVTRPIRRKCMNMRKIGGKIGDCPEWHSNGTVDCVKSFYRRGLRVPSVVWIFAAALASAGIDGGGVSAREVRSDRADLALRARRFAPAASQRPTHCVGPATDSTKTLTQVDQLQPRNPLFCRAGVGIFPLHLGFNF